MTEEGKMPEAEPVQDTSAEGASPQAVYDGPIEKFKGKSATEIAQSFSELESAYGKSQTELNDAKSRVTAYDNWYQQQQQQTPQQVQPQETPDIYENPSGAVQQIATPLIQRELQKMDVQNSFNGYQQTKYLAKQMYPAVFEGVDDAQLDRMMLEGAKANVVGRGGIHHSALRDPESLRMAAWQMKGMQTGYKTHTPSKMDPMETEQPAGTRSEDGSVRMNDYARDAKRLVTTTGSLTEKEAQEVWEQTVKELEGKNG